MHLMARIVWLDCVPQSAFRVPRSLRNSGLIAPAVNHPSRPLLLGLRALMVKSNHTSFLIVALGAASMEVSAAVMALDLLAAQGPRLRPQPPHMHSHAVLHIPWFSYSGPTCEFVVQGTVHFFLRQGPSLKSFPN
jgi:hypothetical protein